jgi:hypothetical protein
VILRVKAVGWKLETFDEVDAHGVDGEDGLENGNCRRRHRNEVWCREENKMRVLKERDQQNLDWMNRISVTAMKTSKIICLDWMNRISVTAMKTSKIICLPPVHSDGLAVLLMRD